MGKIGVLGDRRHQGTCGNFHGPHNHIPVVKQPGISRFPQCPEIPGTHFPHGCDQELSGIPRGGTAFPQNGFIDPARGFKGDLFPPGAGEGSFRLIFSFESIPEGDLEFLHLLPAAENEILFIEEVDKCDGGLIL